MENIVSRAEWNAKEPEFNSLEGKYSEENEGGYALYSELKPGESLETIIDTVVIHHSGNRTFDILGGPPTVGDIQNQHMEDKGWADIGYHYAVDRDGKIYEGRPVDVRGSHTDGENTGKVGVLVLGDYDSTPSSLFDLNTWDLSGDDGPPPEAQIDATKDLIGYLNNSYGIAEVVGHKDIVSGTECPGDKLEPYIPQFNDQLGNSSVIS